MWFLRIRLDNVTAQLKWETGFIVELRLKKNTFFDSKKSPRMRAAITTVWGFNQNTEENSQREAQRLSPISAFRNI